MTLLTDTPPTLTHLLLGLEGVWHLPDPVPFNYTDGNRTETFLQNLFTTTTDLNSNSDSLNYAIYDWPTQYHLSLLRSNLLAGFRIPPSAKVLEVGCGCGAITRWLGERCARVVAVEGSPARAGLARKRTLGMGNVTIINAPFQALEFSEPFDLVVCIGVLEYSALYLEGPDPWRQMLGLLAKQLSARGCLAVAIENRLGAPYFAGLPEDHTGRAFDGIEDYPHAIRGPKTFGRFELETMIAEIIPSTRLFLPFPDYKLPTLVIDANASHSLDLSSLASSQWNGDLRIKPQPLFSLPRAYRSLQANALFADHAPSFLFMASWDEKYHLEFPQLARWWRDDRSLPYRADNRLIIQNEGDLAVIRVPRHDLLPEHTSSLKYVPSIEPWRIGQTILDEVLDLLQLPGISPVLALAPCFLWWDKVTASAKPGPHGLEVGGEWIDRLWQNTMNINGECQFFDQEFVWKFSIPIKILFLRAANVLLDRTPWHQLGPLRRWPGRRNTFHHMAEILGVKLTEEHFLEFIDLESEIQAIVSSLPPNAHNKRILRQLLWSESLFYKLIKFRVLIIKFVKKIILSILKPLVRIG